MKLFYCLFFTIEFSVTASSQNWEQLGKGTNWEVRRIYADTIDNLLYIGGNFKYIGDPLVSDDTLAVNGIAKWEGVGYSALASGQDFCDNFSCSPILAISRFQDEIYCSTTVGSFSGVPVKGIAKWDDTNWQPVGEGLSQEFNQDGTAYSFLIDNDKLLVGGGFTLIGTDTVFGLASWDGASWHSLGFPSVPSFFPFIFAMTIYNGELYIAGNFQALINGQITSDVARFDGTEWHEVGGGLKGAFAFANDLIVFNNELYICGNIEKSAGNAGNMIMKLQNGAWVDVAGGVSYQIHDMVIFNDDLYVSGGFDFVGGNIPASNIAKWTGEKWCSLGSEFNNAIETMEVLNDELYVGGGFTEIDGIPINNIAKWIGGDFVAACTEPVSPAKEQLLQSNVFFLPNPATSEAKIYLPDNVIHAELSLISGLGQLVLTQHLTSGWNVVQLDVLAPGLYFYEVRDEGRVLQSGKLVKVE